LKTIRPLVNDAEFKKTQAIVEGSVLKMFLVNSFKQSFSNVASMRKTGFQTGG